MSTVYPATACPHQAPKSPLAVPETAYPTEEDGIVITITMNKEGTHSILMDLMGGILRRWLGLICRGCTRLVLMDRLLKETLGLLVPWNDSEFKLGWDKGA